MAAILSIRAHALTLLEAATQRLVDALAHRPAWVTIEGSHDERDAFRHLRCLLHTRVRRGRRRQLTVAFRKTSLLCMSR